MQNGCLSLSGRRDQGVHNNTCSEFHSLGIYMTLDINEEERDINEAEQDMLECNEAIATFVRKRDFQLL